METYWDARESRVAFAWRPIGVQQALPEVHSAAIFCCENRPYIGLGLQESVLCNAVDVTAALIK
jgi:hypothetical protein